MNVRQRNQATILIVDDTPANIQILAQALRKHYVIKVASSGQAALDILGGEKQPDLVLLDVMMPEMDGHEVCQRIKNDPATQNIPVIFVTASGLIEEQTRGFNLGAVDYITKPFEIPLVLARVNVHIRLKLKSEQLEKLALVDALTDIPNRRALEETLIRECKRSTRDHTPLSVLMIDVDHFKAFNDHYGHGIGDECLRSVAQSLEAGLLRPGDFVGRYGGEEFVVILQNCNLAGAYRVADKLREQIAGLQIPHAYSAVADVVTVSIGIASSSAAMKETCQDMVNGADQALYTAKSQGRNRVVAYG